MGSISTLYSTQIMVNMPAAVIMNLIDGVWITPGGGEIRIQNTTVRTGIQGGVLLPNVSTCVVANWRVDKYYRGGHPRTYWPGVLSTDVNNGNMLSSTAVSKFQTQAAGWLSGINAMTAGGITKVELGTVSFQTHNTDGDPVWKSPPEFWVYNGASIRAFLGTQRRRITP